MVVDGQIVLLEVDEALASRGLRVGAPDDTPSVGETMTEATDLYAELNTAFASAPIVIDVPDGLSVSAPVVVTHFTASDGIVTLPRVVARVGADASITILDHHSSADVATLTLPVAELAVGAGGSLRYMAVNQLGPRAWQIASQVARGGADSSTLAGERRPRRRLRPRAHRRRARGQGATGNQIAVYFGEQHQMHDFRTLQDHAAPEDDLRPAVQRRGRGAARSVYTGLIQVRKEARGHRRAFQTNRNLKLSEDAWAESVPNLEIETNDVRCSHASAGRPRSTRSSASTSRAAACRPIGRAAHRDRLLQRGARAAARARAGPADLRAEVAGQARAAGDLVSDREHLLLARRAVRHGAPLRRRRRTRSASCASTTTSTRSATRCSHADVSLSRGRGARATSARSSVGSTAARSRWSTGEPQSLPATLPGADLYVSDRRRPGRRRHRGGRRVSRARDRGPPRRRRRDARSSAASTSRSRAARCTR